jgi:hypothetical protein
VEGTGGTNTFGQVPTTAAGQCCNHSSPKAKLVRDVDQARISTM